MSNKKVLPTKYAAYEKPFLELKQTYDALTIDNYFDNVPTRDDMDKLMNWCVNITAIHATLGAIEADSRILLNRLSMYMLDQNDLPEDKDLRRSILGSSTVMKIYIDGKFSPVSRLQAEAENHIRTIRGTLDMMRSIISEHNTSQKLRETERQFQH